MKNLVIYTDGSHLKHTTGRLGIGGILVDEDTGKVIDKFSEELSIDWLKKNYGTSDVSNPTCEMLATLKALEYFSNHIKDANSVCMKADYNGCQNFNTYKWNARLPYIKQIRDETQDKIKSLGLKDKVSFAWVKGHQTVLSRDAMFNDMVDKLAKGHE